VIDAVVADQRYEEIFELEVPSSVGLIAFEFHGMSLKTRPEAMVYRYCLKGYDDDWKNTRERRVEYQNLPVGDYTFEVVAVDRDLVYSEKPAAVRLTVIPDPRDEQIDELEARVQERTRQLEETHRELQEAQTQLIADLEKELQTAHDMQMGLMPTKSPQVPGFDISGRCIPANHVGGDFFQYFPISDNRLSISLADVTGHAMEAAVPVMMFSGVLESEIKHGQNLERLFASLNETLHHKLESRTYICFMMGELDPGTRSFRLSNGGCPFPYHYKASVNEITELQLEAYPLGIRPDTQYPVKEIELEPGDRIVFCSDGIIEAENSESDLFGFERTAETIKKGCEETFNAQQLLDYLISEVKTFMGDTPQGDDQTVVVLAVEE